MRQLKYYHLLILLFLLVRSLSGQTHYYFDHLTVTDGLSQNTVNDIFKDSKGFMWFGTNDGLNRFDGYNFKSYQYIFDDSTSLSNNRVYKICEDGKGNLWIGTKGGLNRYNRNTDNFTRFLNTGSINSQLTNNFVRALLYDSDGNLWIGTLGGGLHVMYKGSDKISWINPTSTGPDYNQLQDIFVTDISEDSEGNIWIATQSKGINKLVQDGTKYIFYPFSRNDRSLDYQLYGKTVLHDSKGNIWVCTEGDGMYRMDIENENIHHYFQNDGVSNLQSNIIKDIIEDEDGNLWIATDGGGLHIYRGNNSPFFNIRLKKEDPRSINSDAIYSLFLDDQQIFWVGTFAGGININDRSRNKFRNYTQQTGNPNSLSHPSVLCFAEDQDGSIWIGTDGGGLNHFDPKTESFESLCIENHSHNCISSKVVTALMIDREDNLWIGTYNGGLNILNKPSGKITHYEFDPADKTSLRNNNIWAIYMDSESVVWIGTSEGLHKYLKGSDSFEFIEPPFYLGSPFLGRITNIYEDRHGNLWFGGAHIYQLDKQSNELKVAAMPESINKRIQDAEIRSIHNDAKDRLWIATEGRGLIMYQQDKDSIRFFSTLDGLPNNSVHRILEDKHGQLWISTNDGLSRLNPTIGEFRNYDMNDGLQSDQFSYSGAMMTSGGYLYFGGVNGFNYFHPDSIVSSTFVPPVLITDFMIFNKPVEIGAKDSPLQNTISETDLIILKHSQSVITFNFASLNYRSPERNQYKVKMEGFEEEWRSIGTQRSATFTNLDAGNYTFRVRGSNNDLFWNDLGTSVDIKVLPPWYKSWYAYVSYTFIILIVLYGYQRAFLKQARLRHDLSIKDLEKQKAEELNQMELRFFTNISHEFKTPLTLIKGPLEQLISESNNSEKTLKKLHTMQTNVQRLLRLINQLLEFRKVKQSTRDLKVQQADIVDFLRKIKEVFEDLAENREIEFIFHTETEKTLIWFDPDKIEKIVYNLLSNAFKYTPPFGKIVLKFKYDPEYLPYKREKLNNRQIISGSAIISVSDTGEGIEEDKLDKIFDRFYMVSDEKMYQIKSESGTGIGLSFCKTLIEQHLGIISVDSYKYKGSNFTIAFPGEKENYKIDEILESEKPIELRISHNSITEDFPVNEKNEWAEKSFKSSDKEGKQTILLVEDNDDVLSFILELLENQYEVLTATNGKDGLENARKSIPDIIITDIMMPEMDGLELSQMLKSDPETCHIPIIILTAKGKEDDRIKGLLTGADDYIAKPFNPKELEQKIKNILYTRSKMWRNFKKSNLLEPIDVMATSFDEEFLGKAMKVIESNIDNPDFDVTFLVKNTGMSRSVLYRKLKALTGQSANEFINTIRLKRAAQLLEKKKFSVSEITYMVGYNDPQYFSKSFKKQFGKTPSQYAQDTSSV